jgi:predicted P-loop ATPase
VRVRPYRHAPPSGPRRYGYGLSVTQRNLTDAIRVAAQKQKFHPIRDFLEAAEWDGKKRLDTMFIDYLGCEDNAFKVLNRH